MQGNKYVASHLAMKLLATNFTRRIGYYLCLFMQSQFQLGSYIHACTNETHSMANLQDLIPTLAAMIKLAKVRIKDLIENVFHLCMHGNKYPA